MRELITRFKFNIADMTYVYKKFSNIFRYSWELKKLTSHLYILLNKKYIKCLCYILKLENVIIWRWE